MNFYNISKGQLVISWFFGVIFFISVIDGCSGYSTTCGPIENLLSLGVMFLLSFYTIGWRNNKKKHEKN